MLDRCARRRRSATAAAPATPAVLCRRRIAGAFNQRSCKYRRRVSYLRSLCLGKARRDVLLRTINLLLDAALHSGLRARCLRRGSPGRVLGTCLGRVLIQRAPRLDFELVAHAHRLLDIRSAHHPGIKHERAARFKSSVSYNSSTLKHDSQEQLCSKGATPLQRHHCTTRRDCKRERCVASSRSQPSQAPRPTLG